MALFNKTLKIKDLLNLDDGRIERSKDLKVTYVRTDNVLVKSSIIDKILKIITGRSRLIFAKIIRYKVESNSGNTYTVLIKVSPGFEIDDFMRQRVEVFCTCDDFKYRAAYGLNRTNNLVKIKATLEHLGIAITTKPTMVSTTPVCKHIYAVINQFRRDYKSLHLVYKVL